MSDKGKKICPRLLDYLVVAGCRYPNGNSHVSQAPELLRRYPLQDHEDFPLPNDVIYFCQPEGCITIGPSCVPLREITSFVFTLTEKDSGLVRYGICINFYRPFERRVNAKEACRKGDKSNTSSGPSLETIHTSDGGRGRASNKTHRKVRVQDSTLTSLCLISHHPFFSTFRQCLIILQRMIKACHARSCVKRVGGSKIYARDSVWRFLTGEIKNNISPLIMHEVREIETWILHLLSAPVPVPGKTRVEVHVLPRELHPPLMFALPDNTRFSLVDFPIHLPLELLGAETCLTALTAIMLEHKVILQSSDYNALTMSVLAFVSMMYPLEYMFPIIPLLPTCMASAEQLLLAPTPYLIGMPAGFFEYRKDFVLPDDIWVFNLDNKKVLVPSTADAIPALPEPEGTVLKVHLKQALASMGAVPQPIKNFDAVEPLTDLWQRKDSLASTFNPLIYGNDVDSVDIATRVAMVQFFYSPNVLKNLEKHTRTLRLYPRPVVAFQHYSFLKSRPERSAFTAKLARTQAVEYLSEWCLSPNNCVYQQVEKEIYDPSLIGDKPKWFSQQLQPLEFHVFDNSSSLGLAITAKLEEQGDNIPTDESGSDSDSSERRDSSYSSLNEHVPGLNNGSIRGEPALFAAERQILAVDESRVYNPPKKLILPDTLTTTSDSAVFLKEDSGIGSSILSSSSFGQDGGCDGKMEENHLNEETVFRYDSGNVVDLIRTNISALPDQIKSSPSSPCSTHSSSFTSTSSLSPRSPPIQSGSASPRVTAATVRISFPLSPRPRSQSGRFTSDPSISARQLDKKNSSDGERSTIFTISQELGEKVSSTVSEPFKSNKSQVKAPPKPFSPLGNRKALVEKGLMKHTATKKKKEPQKTVSLEAKSNSENQQFLKEVVNSVLEGKGLSWMKVNHTKKLMEDESYRNCVVSRLNRNLDIKVSDDAAHLEDVCVSRPVLKGMLALTKAIIHGLCHTVNNHGLGGMASAFMALEIAHTHYWARDPFNKSDGSLTPEKISLHGSHESLELPSFRKFNESTASDWLPGTRGTDSQTSSSVTSPRTPYLSASPGISPASTSTSVKPSEAFTFSSYAGSAADSPGTLDGSESENFEVTSTSDEGYSGDSEKQDKDQSQIKYHPWQTQHDRDGNIQDQIVKSTSDTKVILSVNGDTNTASGLLNGDEQKQRQRQISCDITVTDVVPDSRISQEEDDMLRDIVRNKCLIKTGKMDRQIQSEDSEISDAGTLVSTRSEREASAKRRNRINHQSIRSALSDSEMEINGPGGIHGRHRSSSNIWNTKSTFSSGYRYHEEKLVHVGMEGLTAESAGNRIYLFEGLLGKDRPHIWDNMQFWEDMFLDAVAQERDMIGMDQSPSEMIERYNSMTDVEKKRQEHDEDKLLSDMLYNQTAFMLMMKVPKNEIKKKIRRLLGKSHIGLQQSQDINNLLDNLQYLNGNDIDLKPVCSRRMHKLSFTVHRGRNNKGDMLFMEVYDDCLLLRSVHGAIVDRWWYDELVNMTFCDRTKVFNLWRLVKRQVCMKQFYTNKCRELYLTVRSTMRRTAIRNNLKFPGDPEPQPKYSNSAEELKGNPEIQLECPNGTEELKGYHESQPECLNGTEELKASELEGEFPVQYLNTHENGVLTVKMEGVGFALEGNKEPELFIEISSIKKCFSRMGEIFFLEEYDRKSKKTVEHSFKTSMAEKLSYIFLCHTSCAAADTEQRKQS